MIFKTVKSQRYRMKTGFFDHELMSVPLEEIDKPKNPNVFSNLIRFCLIILTVVLIMASLELTGDSGNDLLRVKSLNYTPSYKPFNDDLNPKNSFEKECYQYINGDQKGLNDTNCFVRTKYNKRLCCHLGVAPSERRLPHVVVLGSNGKVGKEVVTLLKQKNRRVIEVKGSTHINLHVGLVYALFDSINITRVVDVTRGQKDLHNQIYNYFWNSRKIKITRVVPDQFDTIGVQQIVIRNREPFNIQYIDRGASNLYRSIYSCLEDSVKECKKPENNYGTFVIASEVAQLVVDNIDSNNELIQAELKDYSAEFLWNSVLQYKRGKLPKKSPFYSILYDWHKIILEKYSKIYYSQVYTSSNSGAFVDRAQNTLILIEKLLNDFPDMSSEYIQFWIKIGSDDSFFDKITIGEELSKRMRESDYRLL